MLPRPSRPLRDRRRGRADRARAGTLGRLPPQPRQTPTTVPRKSATIPKSTRFEDALGELETIVRALESGEQSLEESLAQFERGVGLSRFCRQSLADAERQVKVLLEEDGEERLADFDTPEGTSAVDPATDSDAGGAPGERS